MTIPELDERGLLPPNDGKAPYCCTLKDVETRFAVDEYRQWLWSDFQSWLRAVRSELTVKALWISGSFLSDKERPSDIDVIAWLPLEDAHRFTSEASRRPFASLMTHKEIPIRCLTETVKGRVQPGNDHVDAFIAQHGNTASKKRWAEEWSGIYDATTKARIGEKGFVEVRL